MELQPEGYAMDKKYPDIIYVPHDVRFDLQQQTVTWPSAVGRADDQAAGGQGLRAPFRLPGAHGKALRATTPGG